MEQDSGLCTRPQDLAVAGPSILQLLVEAVDHDPEVDAERCNDSLSTMDDLTIADRLLHGNS